MSEVTRMRTHDVNIKLRSQGEVTFIHKGETVVIFTEYENQQTRIGAMLADYAEIIEAYTDFVDEDHDDFDSTKEMIDEALKSLEAECQDRGIELEEN